MDAAERGVVKDVEDALSHGANTECTDRVSKSLLYTNHLGLCGILVLVITMVLNLKRYYILLCNQKY